MIHFTKTIPGPSAALQTRKNNGSNDYRLPAVWVQLKTDFHKKCYLCGLKTTSPRIEHFRPHNKGADRNLMFSWDNLFLACEHCNSIKSNHYLGLIDCTSEHPDRHMSFHLDPIADIGKRVIIKKLPTSTINDDTVNLLSEIYSGTASCKKLGAEVIVDELIDELNDFHDLLDSYTQTQNPVELNDLIWEVNNKSKFTAFKRWMVKDNPDYSELLAQHFIN
ncbi:hypothetical protein ACVBIO_03560 [Shewanella sp. 0m-8]